MQDNTKYQKANSFAEEKIVENILSNAWKAGENLPPERELAQQLGITRPTLREALQRLSRDGWIVIRHGKPTQINDFRHKGGFGVLKTIANHPSLAPTEFVADWLQFRLLLLPETIRLACERFPNKIVEKLNQMPKNSSSAHTFTRYDWELLCEQIEASGNITTKLLFNDLEAPYRQLGLLYFTKIDAKNASITYYNALKKAIEGETQTIYEIVKKSLQESIEIWQKNSKK